MGEWQSAEVCYCGGSAPAASPVHEDEKSDGGVGNQEPMTDQMLGARIARRFESWLADRYARLIAVVLAYRRDSCLQVLGCDDDLCKLGMEAIEILDSVTASGGAVQVWQPDGALERGGPVLGGATPAGGDEDMVEEKDGGRGSAPARPPLRFPLAQRIKEEATHREALMARGHESQLRARCEERAREVSEGYKELGGNPSVGDVEYVLELWMGKKNAYRKRVNPKGQRAVRSMSLGLVAQHTGETTVSAATGNYPNITKVLNMFMNGALWRRLRMGNDHSERWVRVGSTS